MRHHTATATALSGLAVVAAIIWRDAVDSAVIAFAAQIGISKETAAAFFVTHPYLSVVAVGIAAVVIIFWTTRQAHETHLRYVDIERDEIWEEGGFDEGRYKVQDRLLVRFEVLATVDDPRLRVESINPGVVTLRLPFSIKPLEDGSRFVLGDHLTFELASYGDDPLRLAIGDREIHNYDQRYEIKATAVDAVAPHEGVKCSFGLDNVPWGGELDLIRAVRIRAKGH